MEIKDLSLAWVDSIPLECGSYLEGEHRVDQREQFTTVKQCQKYPVPGLVLVVDADPVDGLFPVHHLAEDRCLEDVLDDDLKKQDYKQGKADLSPVVAHLTEQYHED
jgi:hypothetical protein